MLKRNAITFWITLFFFVMAIPAYSGILDGKTFAGKNGEIGKKSSEDDEIKFENGKPITGYSVLDGVTRMHQLGLITLPDYDRY